MQFASFTFLFVFLPVFLIAYAVAPARARNPVLLGFSWLFYGWWRPEYLVLLVTNTLFAWWVAERIHGASGAARKQWLRLAVAGCLTPLLWFKYANLLAATFNDLLAWRGHPVLPWEVILLPIGISFFTFQSISYVVDVYRRDVAPAPSFVAFATYLAMFSQLIAGPIVRYTSVAPDISRRPFTLEGFAAGSRRFMFGLAMKVLVADSLAPVADAALGLAQPTFWDAWIGTLAFALQLLFDFAGYSAMAIGLGRMIGFHFPENFEHPYLAGSIRAFWRRWHTSLSTWLRDYLYIPLGGNRHGSGRTYLALILTLALGGLWHGANWTFLAWGLLHGTALSLQRFWHQQALPKPPWLVGHLFTLLLVGWGWALFRSPDLSTAARHLGALFDLAGAGDSDSVLLWNWRPQYSAAFAAGLALVYLPALPGLKDWGRRDGWSQNLAAPVLGLWSVALIADRTATPFLYFQF